MKNISKISFVFAVLFLLFSGCAVQPSSKVNEQEQASSSMPESPENAGSSPAAQLILDPNRLEMIIWKEYGFSLQYPVEIFQTKPSPISSDNCGDDSAYRLENANGVKYSVFTREETGSSWLFDYSIKLSDKQCLVFTVASEPFCGLEKAGEKCLDEKILTAAGALMENSFKIVSKTEVAPKKEEELRVLSDKVLGAIKQKDFKTVASFVGADKKLCFSPYAYVSEADKCFSKDELAKALAGDEKYVWGAYDGRGGEILLTFGEYYQQFIYNKDYVNKSEYFFNHTAARGNTIANFKEAYPNGFFSEYYIKAGEDGYDWDSLNMVFEEVGGQLYLRAIIHDQWTI